MPKPQTLSLTGVSLLPKFEHFRPAVLETTDGTMEARWYEAVPAGPAKVAILWLGDDQGDFDSPANGLYDRLAEKLLEAGVSSLRLQYRRPGDPVQSGLDALVAAHLLQRLEVDRIVAVGWGIGALGALQAAHQFQTVAALALIAPRNLAQDATKGLARPLSLWLGTADPLVDTRDARDLLANADEPKRIHYYPDAGHALNEAAEALENDLKAWLAPQLGV